MFAKINVSCSGGGYGGVCRSIDRCYSRARTFKMALPLTHNAEIAEALATVALQSVDIYDSE